MSKLLALICSVLLLMSMTVKADYRSFQIKQKPGTEPLSVRVLAGDDKQTYATASVLENTWDVEVRGQLTLNEAASGYRIEQARIRYGKENSALQNYEIGVSGNNRSLTGNHGHQWASHNISLNQVGNAQVFVSTCNQAVASDLSQGLTNTQALNKKRVINIDSNQSGFKAALWINVSQSPNYLTEEASVKLPIKVICQPTSYEKPKPTASDHFNLGTGVEESHLTILEQFSRISGVCKVTLSGVIKTNLPNSPVKFQYEHTNGNRSDIKSVTTSHARTAMFSHTYDINNNPYDDEAGSIRIVGVSPKFQSPWKTYTMRCEDVATSDLQTELPPQLTLDVLVGSTHLVKGQICPKNLLIKGHLKAGSSIEGHAVFIGSGVSEYQSQEMPYDLNIGETKNFIRVRQAELPSTLGSLQVTNDSAPALKKVSITQGMTLMDENNQLLATTGQKNYSFSCSWPQTNPNIQPSGTLGLSPDHTGGGGSPTKLTSKPSFNRGDSQSRSGNSGLRSDGELVQSKKPRKLISHELSHTKQQQGRMLTDSDINEASKSKPSSPNPVPIPYPVIGNIKDSKNKQGNNNQRALNSHDQFANQQTSHFKIIRLPLGAKCNKLSFPKNAAIVRFGKQQAVECSKGNITLKRRTTKFKSGFTAPINKNLPKKIIKKGDMSDEMPEYIPAG